MFQQKYRAVTILLLFVMAWVVFISVSAETETITTSVCGTITEDSTWTATESPYIICNDDYPVRGVSVPEGVVLTIEAGVIVKFEGFMSSLEIAGTLIAQGTESNPIVFTSYKDDTHGGDTNSDGAVSVPQPSDWGQIYFTGSSTNNLLEYVWIGYGGAGDYYHNHIGMLNSYFGSSTADLIIRHSTITHSARSVGFYIVGNWPLLDDVTFSENYDAIHWIGDINEPVIMQNSHFISNTGQAVLFDDFLSPAGIGADLTFLNNTMEGNGLNGIFFGGHPTFTRTVTIKSTSPTGALPILFDFVTGVASNSELNLAPGTVVKLPGEGGVDVIGRFNAIGTPDQPIIFTSLADDTIGGDTNNDGDASAPAAGQWRGINFLPSATGRFENVIARYGGAGTSGGYTRMMELYSNDVVLQDSTFSDSARAAILIQDSSPQLENLTLTRNEIGVEIRRATEGAIISPKFNRLVITNNRYGISLNSKDVTPIMRESVIFNNFDSWGSTGVVHNGGSVTSAKVDFRHNFWGNRSGPAEVTFNPFGTGDKIQQHGHDLVDFIPWLEVPPPDTLVLDSATVDLRGTTSTSPGGTASYQLSYANFTGETIEDAVLIFYLPPMAYRANADDDALIMLEKRQVAWRLGDLPHGASGTQWVTADMRWGEVSGDENVAVAVIAGSNYNIDVVDVTPYLTYHPMTIDSSRLLDSAEWQILLADHPDLNNLYTVATQQQFHFALAEEWVLSSGEKMIVTVLFAPNERGFRFLVLQNGTAVAITAGGNQYSLTDGNGGAQVNVLTRETLFWGTWSADGSLSRSCSGLGCCLHNAMFDAVVDSAVGMVPIANVVATGKSCLDAAHAGDYLACGSAILENTVEGSAKTIFSWVSFLASPVKALSSCLGDSSAYGCQQNSIQCSGSSTVVTFRCEGNCLRPVGERTYCPTDESCVPGTGCVDCAADDVACRTTRLARARDPNEKHGEEGALLPGEWVDYSIEYENVGAGEAYNVYIVDPLSSAFDLTTVQLTGDATYYDETKSIVFYIGTLAPYGEDGSKGEVTFRVRLRDDLPSGTDVVNIATVYFPSVPEKTETNAVVNRVQPLVATAQSITVESGQSAVISLSGRDVIGSPLTYQIARNPLHGTLSGTPPNLTYTPLNQFSGVDQFAFVVNNGTMTSDFGWVMITVTPDTSDTIPPYLMWSDPMENSSLFVTDTISTTVHGTTILYEPFIYLGFSEGLDVATVSADTIHLRTTSGTTLPITIGYDDIQKMVWIAPQQPLAFEDDYVVSAEISDLMGNVSAEPVMMTFRTGSDLPTHLTLTETSSNTLKWMSWQRIIILTLLLWLMLIIRLAHKSTQ